MHLEKKDKISQPESVFQRTLVNIIFTYNWCNDKIKTAVTPYAITTQQFNVLRILYKQYPDPATINFIKSRMLDKMSDASRIVDRLIQKGLVVKSNNLTDKRASDIKISDVGLKLLGMMEEKSDISELVAANLTEHEAMQLSELLDKLRG